jgi:hypothetical protein
MGYYLIYTDNLNLRFWLTVFLVISSVYLTKIGVDFYLAEDNPSIIDKYAQAVE